ncbi:FUSC family protein [Oceaniglobus roseus]|uniref:FUSC family protein n=1 Tax=Oceaniglobus roseus TaxID=1737570 RepID=UPI000C7F4303|nr:FUSC family protein [Kandeliimicrobium roseum]
MGRIREWIAGDQLMPWAKVGITLLAVALPPVVAVLLFGRVGAVAFVAAMPAHLAAKDNGTKVALLVTLVMGMAGLLSLGRPDMAILVAVCLGLMVGRCGTWGLARPCIQALLTWTIFTSPIIAGSELPLVFGIFVAGMLWALAVTWWFGQTFTTGDEPPENAPHAVAFGLVMAVGLGISVWAGGRFFGSHGFWLPLTFVVLCLPPHGELFRRTLKRFAGTFIGTGLALALAWVSQAMWVEVLAGALCLPLAFRYMPKSYTLFTALLTVSVLEILAQVSDVDQLAGERLWTMVAAALLTVGLGALAWVALRLFRPEALKALLDEG